MLKVIKDKLSKKFWLSLMIAIVAGILLTVAIVKQWSIGWIIALAVIFFTSLFSTGWEASKAIERCEGITVDKKNNVLILEDTK